MEDSNRGGMKGVTIGYLDSKYFNSFFNLVGVCVVPFSKTTAANRR